MTSLVCKLQCSKILHFTLQEKLNWLLRFAMLPDKLQHLTPLHATCLVSLQNKPIRKENNLRSGCICDIFVNDSRKHIAISTKYRERHSGVYNRIVFLILVYLPKYWGENYDFHWRFLHPGRNVGGNEPFPFRTKFWKKIEIGKNITIAWKSIPSLLKLRSLVVECCKL